MKEAYRFQNIRLEKMAIIEVINEILDEGLADGYRLTLRQLYYQLVSRNIIENKVQEYSKLSSTLVTARMNGLTDWDAIEDRIRQPYLPYSVDGVEGAIQDTIDTYRLDRQWGQPYYMEIWTEKDAVSNILKRVSVYYHIRLMVNRGYSSCSAMKDAFDRMDLDYHTKVKKVLYVGDHDPSGLDMLRDIRERLSEFGLNAFEIIPVALTREQINEYNPPPNPAKITDPRAKWYIENFGDKSWELDALRPEILHDIVKKAVKEYLDEDIFKNVIKQEFEDKRKLRKILKE